MEAKIEWSPEFLRNVDLVMSPGGLLQKRIDGLIYQSIEPYMPFDQGVMYRSAANSAAQGIGKLVWTGPQVRMFYHGIIMVDPIYHVGGFHDPTSGRFWSRPGITKIPDPQGRTFNFRGGGKRGSHWPERWMADNLQQFEKDLQREAGRLLQL